MASKNSNSPSRTRNYMTLVYPESAPSNWLSILEESAIPCLVSPLHNKDVNEADNEPKKEHYHVMLLFDGPKTLTQATEIVNSFSGVGCIPINSVRGQARYLCHMDNPDKAQYSADDVKAFGGADYRQIIGTAADKAKAIREMIEWIEENDVTCWADLLTYSSINRSDWFDTLINSGAYVTKEFIKSRTWKLHHEEER